MKISARRITRDALLTAIALTVFMLEAQIPPPIPVPGMKLGLANVITVYAMFAAGSGDAFVILLCRIILGSLFGGGSAFLYSLCGGMLCFLSMLPLHKVLTEKQLWVCGAVAAIFHNIGQIAAAILISGTPALVSYLPLLLIVGIPAGAFTGFLAQLLLKHLPKSMRSEE